MRRLASIALLLLASPASAAMGPKPTLVIAADPWCPINCEPGAREGFGVDLARAALSKHYTIEYRITSWARALDDVRNGKIDAVIGANRQDDAGLVFPKHPIYRMTDDFYVRSNSPIRYHGMASLRGLRIGSISHYGYGLRAQRLIGYAEREGLLEETSGNDALLQNIRKLIAGRIDILIESEAVMHEALNTYGFKNDVRRIGGVPQGEVFLAFSPAHSYSQRRADQYDEAISKLQAAGELASYYQRYGIDYE